jgi:CRISPR-associated protein Cas1
MIKRTLYFTRACHLSVRLNQLHYEFKDTGEFGQAPIEDLGVIVLEHDEITLTQLVLAALLENNTAVVTCNKNKMPVSLTLALDGHQLQQERFRFQIEASAPLKKQLWAQTIKAKLKNQGQVLKLLGKNDAPLFEMARIVKSGDESNVEARGSKYYWSQLFSDYLVEFRRERFGMPPNPALNYGYAIVRAAVARGLIGSGLLPTFGIHHHNRYNAYCLADDIMEPYRPFVDATVVSIMQEYSRHDVLTKEIKAKLLSVLSADVFFKNEKSPLLVGISTTTASLYKCFSGEQKQINYPTLAC